MWFPKDREQIWGVVSDIWDSQVALVVKIWLQRRRWRSIPGSEISPGGGHGNPLQCSCLGNPKDRGAWRATVHRVSKSRTWLKWLNIHVVTSVLSVVSVCLVAQSCPALCDPMDCKLLGFSDHRDLPAKILEWVAAPSYRRSSQPRERTQVSRFAGGSLTIWGTREALEVSETLFMYVLLICCTRSSLQRVRSLVAACEWNLSCGMWDLVPWPGIKSGPHAFGAQSLSHWTTREVPIWDILTKENFVLFLNRFRIFAKKGAVWESLERFQQKLFWWWNSINNMSILSQW